MARNLREIFALIDTDGSGCLSSKEIAVLMAALDASLDEAEGAALLAHHDLDGGGIDVVDTAEVRRVGPERAAARCLEHLADRDRLYVSFDVDSIDAALCKGTGTPVPGTSCRRKRRC